MKLDVFFVLFLFQNQAVFSTYVVASGCLYGKGEQFMHYFFKVGYKCFSICQESEVFPLQTALLTTLGDA